MKIFVVTASIKHFENFVLDQPEPMRKFYHYLTDTRRLRGVYPLIVIYADRYWENKREFLDEIEMIIKCNDVINKPFSEGRLWKK